MIYAMSEKEVKEYRQERVEWVKRIMKTDYGHHVGNILNQLEMMVNEMERLKK